MIKSKLVFVAKSDGIRYNFPTIEVGCFFAGRFIHRTLHRTTYRLSHTISELFELHSKPESEFEVYLIMRHHVV